MVQGRVFNMNCLVILIFRVTGKQPALETCLQKVLGREEDSLSGQRCPSLEAPESRLSRGAVGVCLESRLGLQFPRGFEVSQGLFLLCEPYVPHTPPVDSSAITSLFSAPKSSVAHCYPSVLDAS